MYVVAVIGDIHSSRAAKDRQELQHKLLSTLKKVNRRNKSLLSPFTITLGDEFQAVYQNANNLFIDIWTIVTELYPQKFRFAFGVGNLTTQINRKQAIGMDGPAFHYARQCIQDLKETSNLFKILGEQLAYPEILNQSLNLISHQIAGWEKNRFRILAGLYRNESSKEMSTKLGISTVAVYKNINAGALKVIKTLTLEIGKVVNNSLEKE